MSNGYRTNRRGMSAVAERMRRTNRRLSAVAARAGIRSAVISGGALRSADFDGTGPSSPGTAGWWLGSASGIGELIVNDIVLRDGIVGNDALTNPVIPDFLYGDISNFAVTTTLTNRLTINATVPAGCTRLASIAVGRVYAVNGTASLDYLFGQMNIAGFNGDSFPLPVSGSGGSGTNVSPYAVLLVGLTPGSHVAFQMAVSSDFASWGTNASNMAEISALLLWFR